MVHDRERVMVLLLLALVVIAGCVACAKYSLPSTMDQLQAGGYTQSRTVGTTATGERRESQHYEIWWKEFRGQGRIRHFCFVPGARIKAGGYQWKIAVSVDDRQVWEWQSGPFQGNPAPQWGITCTETPPLPEGRVSWRVSSVYWQ